MIATLLDAQGAVAAGAVCACVSPSHSNWRELALTATK